MVRADRRLRRRIAALTAQDMARADAYVSVFNDAEGELRLAREALVRGDYGRRTEFGLRVAAAHGVGDAVLCLVVLYRRLGWGDLAGAWLTIAVAEGWEPDDVVDADQEYQPAPGSTRPMAIVDGRTYRDAQRRIGRLLNAGDTIRARHPTRWARKQEQVAAYITATVMVCAVCEEAVAAWATRTACSPAFRQAPSLL